MAETGAQASGPDIGRRDRLPLLLAVLAAFMLVPLCLAAGIALLPELLRTYVLILPLPVLLAETFTIFSLLVLPLFCAGDRGAGNAGLLGVLRGSLCATVAMLLVVLARVAGPVSTGNLLLIWLLMAVVSSGAGAASAAWGARGALLAIGLSCLPGLAGYFARDVYPAAILLMRLSPIAEIARVAGGGGVGWACFLPGLGLISAGFTVRSRRV